MNLTNLAQTFVSESALKKSLSLFPSKRTMQGFPLRTPEIPREPYVDEQPNRA